LGDEGVEGFKGRRNSVIGNINGHFIGGALDTQVSRDEGIGGSIIVKGRKRF